jgi:hypothetical protein
MVISPINIDIESFKKTENLMDKFENDNSSIAIKNYSSGVLVPIFFIEVIRFCLSAFSYAAWN